MRLYIVVQLCLTLEVSIAIFFSQVKYFVHGLLGNNAGVDNFHPYENFKIEHNAHN